MQFLCNFNKNTKKKQKKTTKNKIFNIFLINIKQQQKKPKMKKLCNFYAIF